MGTIDGHDNPGGYRPPQKRAKLSLHREVPTPSLSEYALGSEPNRQHCLHLLGPGECYDDRCILALLRLMVACCPRHFLVVDPVITSSSEAQVDAFDGWRICSRQASVLLPVNAHNHWLLGVLPSGQGDTIFLFNPSPHWKYEKKAEDLISGLLDRIEVVHSTPHANAPSSQSASGYSTRHWKYTACICPEQKNPTDCGPFTVGMAAFIIAQGGLGMPRNLAVPRDLDGTLLRDL